jgi:hypothetical protein
MTNNNLQSIHMKNYLISCGKFGMVIDRYTYKFCVKYFVGGRKESKLQNFGKLCVALFTQLQNYTGRNCGQNIQNELHITYRDRENFLMFKTQYCITSSFSARYHMLDSLFGPFLQSDMLKDSIQMHK